MSDNKITFGSITVETTKRYVKTFGPNNIVKESNNRKAKEKDWTECERIKQRTTQRRIANDRRCRII